VEWPKEISKFFSRQKLASISQVGFRVIIIRCLLQELRILLGVLSDCEELLGVSHRRCWGWVYDPK